jgi:hypothetical protein
MQITTFLQDDLEPYALAPEDRPEGLLLRFDAAKAQVEEEIRQEEEEEARGKRRSCCRFKTELGSSPLLRTLNVAFGRKWTIAGLYLLLARSMLVVQPLLIRMFFQELENTGSASMVPPTHIISFRHLLAVCWPPCAVYLSAGLP